MKKILALILILCTVACASASCAKNNVPTDTDSEQITDNSNTEEISETVNNDQFESISETEGEVATSYVPKNESTAGLKFKLNADEKSYTLVGIGTCAAIEITIDGYQNLPVTRIEASAFKDCINITSVSIGNGVTSIGDEAFHGCIGLTSIKIPNNLTDLGSNIFVNTGYYNDESNWFKGALYLDKYLIDAKNTMFGEHIVKDGTKYICNYAFSGCTGLSSIAIPDSVISIGNNAFEYCAGLTSVIIPNTVISIGDSAFKHCTGLKSATLLTGVENIGNNTFFGCTALESIILPATVTSIGECAFYKCNALATINYRGSQEDWDAITKGANWNYDLPKASKVTYNYSK